MPVDRLQELENRGWHFVVLNEASAPFVGNFNGLTSRASRGGFREKTRSGLNAGGAAPCEGNQSGPCQLPFKCPAPIDSAAVGFDNDK